ncbi:MAG: hydrogenase expression/formation protein HypE [Gammaproteobacteria bacterium]|nr:hydrogenase expression/formation protein HypE [Gammaproteobacteria bacterium]MCP5198948.1 hydrogenase expression/formation protein HypE [Gammaproteobacteria bacterium]
MNDTVACPLPRDDTDCVTLAHGGGGALMQRLVREVFAAAFGNDARHDGARVDSGGRPLVTTTDAFVVKPLFFPGGDIGALAVHGTVNDLAMCGARPLALTASFVIEEGFAVADLRRIAASMARAARAAGVAIVSGDTKVVERGHGDGVYITTSGIGALDHGLDIHPRAIAPGDAVLLSGDIGRHGTAVMVARENLHTATPISSDQGNLWPAVAALLAAGIEVHCLRDLTRGGLATAMVELARDGGWGIGMEETAVAVEPTVAALCELFGLDPLYVANEGRFVAVVPDGQATAALAVLRETAAAASLLGHVSAVPDGRVRLRTRYGTTRHVALLSGAQLPRIC